MKTLVLLSLLACSSAFAQSTTLLKGYSNAMRTNRAAAATNDDCGTAIDITCGQSIAGETLTALDDTPNVPGDCGAGGTDAPGVWYHFVGNGDDVTAATCDNADYDTRISVYSGTCGALQCEGGNDDGTGCTAFSSSVDFSTVAGVDYYIMVHGFTSAQGNFTLTLTCSTACTPVPTNDDCATATAVTVQASGACVPQTFTNTCSAAALSNPGCDMFGAIKDVWFSFNSGTDTLVLANLTDVTNTTGSLNLAVYNSCGAQEIFCSANASGTTSIFPLVANTDYLLQVWTGASEEGDFTLCMEEQPAAGACGYGVSAFATDLACNNDATGSASALITGGVPAYTYLWSNGAATNVINGLSPGVFTVTMTDQTACSTIRTVTVGEPDALLVSVTSQNGGCSAGNGSATTAVSGGNGGYLYSWSNGSTTSSITGLAANVYSLSITDMFGCTVTGSSTITSVTALSNVTNISHATCGDSNAEINNGVSGGDGNYTYIWSNGETTSDLANLAAGTYSITINDGTNCELIESYLVTTTAAITGLTISTTDAGCGASNGTAQATAVGGTPTITFSWSNGGNADNITGLSAGTYYVTATDGVGCSAIANALINNAGAATISLTSTNATCIDAQDGSASVAVSGGQTPYNYTWHNGSGSLIGTGTAISNVAPGTYFVTVSDGQVPACITSGDITVIADAPVAIAPVITVPNCSGEEGSITAFGSGGALPYTYLWSTGNTTMIQNGIAGTYLLTTTDNNGCASTTSIDLNEPTALSVVVSITATTCGNTDGAASLIAQGGSGVYELSWSTGQTTAMVSGLAAGNYNVSIVDDNGCSLTENLAISNDDGPVVSTTGSVLMCFGQSAGTVSTSTHSTYSYLWSNGATTATLTGLNAGQYDVTVSAAGCDGFGTSQVLEPSNPLAVNVAVTDETTQGANDGSATATPSGGTPNYTYFWSTLATTAGINGLSPQTYSIVVTDANGCTSAQVITVSSGGDPCLTTTITLTTTSTNATPPTPTNGTVTVWALGGLAPYTYLWDNAATVNPLTNLLPGSYLVTVSDANGCTETIVGDVELGTGISMADAFDLRVFPNPSNGDVHVTTSRPVNMRVENELGQLVLEQQIEQSTDIKLATAGIYFIRLWDNEETKTIKLVVR